MLSGVPKAEAPGSAQRVLLVPFSTTCGSGADHMSSTPERDTPGQLGSTPHGTHPGMPQQRAMPGQEQDSGVPYGTTAGQGPSGETGGDWVVQPSRPGMVDVAATRVTGRRVVQYLIDSFLVWLIPGLISIPFDRSSST